MKRLIIIGASGHGKVISDIAIKNGYKDIVFLDDNENIKSCAGFIVAGKVEEFNKMMDSDFIVAIGNAKIRRKIQNKIPRANVITLIHPNAVIGKDVEIGCGTVVMAGAVINSGATIGTGCIINTSCSVDHDCKIDDFVHISVGSHVAGTVSIGKDTWIGAGAVISNNIQICKNCIIGAGGVVIEDIYEPGIYIGTPVKKR